MVNKAKVTSRVVAYIREQIVSGAWVPGTKLPSENKLCSELGCSRISIRSALQQFIAIGAIESVHGKGSFLRSTDLRALGQDGIPVSHTRLMDMLDFAALVWPGICTRAAQQNRPEVFQTLSEVVTQMRALTPSQMPVLCALVDSFHRTIALSLENDTLMQAFTYLLNQIDSYPCNGNPTTVYYGSIYHHDLLLTAMRNGDPERIRTAVQDYFNHVKHDFYGIPASAPEHGTRSEEGSAAPLRD